MSNEIDNTTANPAFLTQILLSGGLIGKLSSQEEVDKIYEKLLIPEYQDTIFEHLLKLIDMDSDEQDSLVEECDDIIQSSVLIDEEDENLRADLSTLFNDTFNTTLQNLEAVVLGSPEEEESEEEATEED